MRRICAGLLAAAALFGSTGSGLATVVDFEDLTLAPGSYVDGLPGAPYGDHSFQSRGVTFSNTTTKDPSYGYEWWSGWAYSNMTDSATNSVANEGSAYPSKGAGNSANYAVAYGDAAGGESDAIFLPSGSLLKGAYFASTTYSYLTMKNGDPYGFSNPIGKQGDFVSVTVHGYDTGNQSVGMPVTFYLADFRSSNPSQWYFLDDWKWIDLSSLSGAAKLTFSFDANAANKSDYGLGPVMDHPAYVAIDNLTAVPEPSTLASIVAGGAALLLWRWRRRKSGV